MAITKKMLEEKYIAHFARELDVVVETEFGGNQTEAAKALGMSQPHLSNLINTKSGRGPGLQTLLIMRAKTNRSIDSLLGLPPIAQEELTERLRMTVDTEIARIKRAAKLEVEALKKQLESTSTKASAGAEPKTRAAK